MRKLFVATTFAAVTLATYSAAACDRNREASAKTPVLATTAPSTTLGQAARGAAPLAPIVADEGKPVEESAPIIPITARH
jgi:hypothetical protein